MKMLNHKVLIEIEESQGDYSSLIVRPESTQTLTNSGIVRSRAGNSNEGIWEGDAVLLNIPLEEIKENIFYLEEKPHLVVWDHDILCVFAQ